MDLSSYIVSEEETILNVLKKIDENSKGIVFICNNNKLLASVTDGDIRRYIINNGNLDNIIKTIGNYNPYYIYNDENINYKKYMEENDIISLPILNRDDIIINIKFLKKNKKFLNNSINIPVVIMAGGKGTRLKPYTNILPKPLMPIGEKTITEHIIDSFEKYGCNDFHMIVNYKKNFIKTYFSEINKKINFIDEEIFLGTGGGLYLIKDKIKETVFLTNCDVLIDYDYSKILEKHKKMGNIATVICIEKNQNLSYGVIDIDDNGNILKMREKPKFSFIINTGIYIIEPEFLQYIPKDTFIHITDIIERCISDGKNIGTYVLKEECWFDMGQFDEMEKMKERLEI
ncbi:sugar phosphate nucleotidyltransferase [uncultured Tyzzerella sp.]|uniref:sugar phosphate nucleotidyltransferase n=1 Tax=uncultured Tyzzerella sp. TaxID=2321398 RepID=UPI00294294D3|nr:sugar phosphate nucleotidyltransferase [uncultured Tyzzerella sp.]